MPSDQANITLPGPRFTESLKRRPHRPPGSEDPTNNAAPFSQLSFLKYGGHPKEFSHPRQPWISKFFHF